jgi:cytochrome b subunit of formate dehydrogenase
MTEQPANPSNKVFIRFDIFQRIEHFSLLVSFTTLAVTGLPQKYISAEISLAILRLLGGIEQTRLIHHVAAAILLFVSIFHVLSLLYRMFVLRSKLSMMPWIDDFKHLLHDIGYYLGMRKRKAYYGHYSYAEKVEYLAVVWGTVIMAITGFMMWNPISTARLLPGEAIPAAKVAHGFEAVLAVLAILLWHFYHVHIKHLNKSIFTGKTTREEMEHEHPAELAQIEAGDVDPSVPTQVLRKRQGIYFPVAFALTAVFGFSLFKFLTIEKTAITTLPPAERAQVFVPVTPTARPVPTQAPTPTPGAGIAAVSWQGTFDGLFRNRCSTCHGRTKVGGLTLATFQDALAGGDHGPAIVPGDPDASVLVQVQSQGDHPGQLTAEELKSVIEWITKGAPEK